MRLVVASLRQASGKGGHLPATLEAVDLPDRTAESSGYAYQLPAGGGVLAVTAVPEALLPKS